MNFGSLGQLVTAVMIISESTYAGLLLFTQSSNCWLYGHHSKTLTFFLMFSDKLGSHCTCLVFTDHCTCSFDLLSALSQHLIIRKTGIMQPSMSTLVTICSWASATDMLDLTMGWTVTLTFLILYCLLLFVTITISRGKSCLSRKC